jgi:5'-3' exonuclease
MFDPETLIPLRSEDFNLNPEHPVVLIDSSGVLHRNYYGKRNGHQDDPKFTGEVSGYVSDLLKLHETFPSALFIQCLDAKKCEKREIFEDYKSGRPDSKSVFAHFSEILSVSALLPRTYVSYVPNTEADDILCTLAQTFFSLGFQTYIYTRDHDMFQALREGPSGFVRIFWEYEDRKPCLKTVQDCLSRFQVHPENIPLYKSLIGDRSDTYTGYSRMYKEHAALISERFTTPEALLSSKVTDFPPRVQRALDRVKSEPYILERNYSLAKIREGQTPGIYTLPSSWEPLTRFGLLAERSRILSIQESNAHPNRAI